MTSVREIWHRLCRHLWRTENEVARVKATVEQADAGLRLTIVSSLRDPERNVGSTLRSRTRSQLDADAG